MTKITAGSNALHMYRTAMGGKKGFRKTFPLLGAEEDARIRRSYRGGFAYVNPRFQGTEQGAGIVLDVNSLYPSVMAGCAGEVLPFGPAIPFEGAPPDCPDTPLWVADVECAFSLKPEHLPTVQMKGSAYRFNPTEYITDSQGIQTLTLTSVDWALLCDQYDVTDATFTGGFMFRASGDLFRGYVDHWTEVKVRAGKEGNKGMRQIAKLQLNSLYGKFATRTTVGRRKPVMEGGVVRYRDLLPEEREPVYLPVGTFVTAWARNKTIRSSQAVFERFMYADTDSMHLLGTEYPENVDVDDYRLGAWKVEERFERAKYLRAKCYTEYLTDGTKSVHVSGLPYACHDFVDMENFDYDAVYPGKLYQHRVPGGIVLVEGDFQIRR